MNKYIARAKKFNQKHETAISTVVTVMAAVLIYKYKRGVKKADLRYGFYRDQAAADACRAATDHVKLMGDSMKKIDAGDVVEFVELVVMSKDTWKKLKGK